MKYTNLKGKKFIPNGLKYVYSKWEITDGPGYYGGGSLSTIIGHYIPTSGKFQGQECIAMSSGEYKSYYIFPVGY